ncbi:MAG TPA: diversity-generating retroelement protein Avd [Anaerolineaceae bacterium]|nr:diversity-generating retroelement protein Avd [Anaerolineaceae bacterium]HQF44370.1 diversity-generating retroelement protein Avd [Anaerolineaceae bacterium]HQH34072.1 diversity-generating retroelement protein Avd [Anaerolineaceae bacterium]HQJ02936.1 diversity-generating retroelement protein Avd [Anaerolineaceae bacterium]
MNESPLFTRTYDFLLWMIPHTIKFPRVHRFGLGERIQQLALNFQDTLVAAGKSHGSRRIEYLQKADIQLEQMRVWLRFSRDNNLLTINQYEHGARLVTEIGKLLGTWLKQNTSPAS